MSTMPGKLAFAVPDQGLAVGASATVNGAAAYKGTATDAVVILSTSGTTGTVTPVIQGTNTPGVPASWVNVTPDYGTLTNLAAGAGVQYVHLAQLQFAYYRVSYTSGATSGTTATDVFVFMPVQDSNFATVQ